MSQQTVTTTDDAFTIIRTFDAPLAQVWDVWTRREHFAQWFHAKPDSVVLEVRAGGPWRATMDTPVGEMTMAGVYREVVDHEKLVWTMDGAGEPVVMTAVFADRDGRTQAAYSQNVTGGYSCDQAVAGATGILDSFEQYLDTLPAPTP